MVKPLTTVALPVTVALVDECELVVNGVAAILAGYDDLALIPVRNRRSPVRPDLILYDPPDLPWPAATEFPVGGPETQVVVYTWNPSPGLVEAAVRRGARGCLSKSLPADDLANALRRIHKGHLVVDDGERGGSRWRPLREDEELLTGREREVIGLVAAGLSNREIAETMTLSINSIKSYIRSAYRKIGVGSRSQAVLWGVRHGCVAPEAPGRTWPASDGVDAEASRAAELAPVG